MSLQQPYDPDNIFAKIIRGEMPCVKLMETDNVLAFMDVFPQSKGHCLVIHKKSKAVNILDVEPEALNELIGATQTLARAVEKALEPDGIRVMQFSGARAGQTIFHLHFHVLPVYEGVVVAAHASGKPANAEELEPIADKIRKALG
ncbi:HIT family protein [Hyphococcus luteus]|uniref:HIT family protein n=1 Tax=Hyphococcus luteus TaxID=2058213 RepID=A0A2S7JZL5_9PROT|nr:HIT family protein [Marinicaulis flavus]PQA85694.1 HIT family protein [Marinicaulis flavus]